MNKLIVFFLFMLLGCGLLVGIVAGGGGVTTTYLSTNASSNQTYLNVTSTNDFLDEDDVVLIGLEKIHYGNTTSTAFVNCTRGYSGTSASAHLTGVKVYTERASAINNALGFNIGAMQDSLGWAAIIAIPFKFFVTTIPHIMKMSTTLLTGDLAIISWILYVMAAGFVITLAMALISGIRTR